MIPTVRVRQVVVFFKYLSNAINLLIHIHVAMELSLLFSGTNL